MKMPSENGMERDGRLLDESKAVLSAYMQYFL